MDTLDYLKDKYNRMVLSKTELAKELGVCTLTIDRMRKRGHIESKKVLGKIKFRITDVANYMEGV